MFSVYGYLVNKTYRTVTEFCSARKHLGIVVSTEKNTTFYTGFEIVMNVTGVERRSFNFVKHVC